MTINTALLSSLVAATRADSFLWLAEADYEPLVAAGYAVTNAAIPGAPEEGQVATRATQAGVDALNAPVQQSFGSAPATTGFTAAPQNDGSSAAVFVAPTEKQKFAFVSNFQPPAKKPRGVAPGVGEEKYPFGELQAPTINADGSRNFNGAAIFIPSNTHTKGPKKGQIRTSEEMAFSLVSACSAANRRYATVTGTEKTKAGKDRNVYAYSRDFKSAPAGSEQPVPGAYIYRDK